MRSSTVRSPSCVIIKTQRPLPSREKWNFNFHSSDTPNHIQRAHYLKKKKRHNKTKLKNGNDVLLSTDRKNLMGREKKLIIRLMKNRFYWLGPLDHSQWGQTAPPSFFPTPLAFVCCPGQGWEQERIQKRCLGGKRLESDQSPSSQGPVGAQHSLNSLHVPRNSLSTPPASIQAALHPILSPHAGWPTSLLWA